MNGQQVFLADRMYGFKKAGDAVVISFVFYL